MLPNLIHRLPGTGLRPFQAQFPVTPQAGMKPMMPANPAANPQVGIHPPATAEGIAQTLGPKLAMAFKHAAGFAPPPATLPPAPGGPTAMPVAPVPGAQGTPPMSPMGALGMPPPGAQPGMTPAPPGAQPPPGMPAQPTAQAPGGPPGAPGAPQATPPMLDPMPQPLPANPRPNPPRAWTPQDASQQAGLGSLLASQDTTSVENPAQTLGDDLMGLGAKAGAYRVTLGRYAKQAALPPGMPPLGELADDAALALRQAWHPQATPRGKHKDEDEWGRPLSGGLPGLPKLAALGRGRLSWGRDATPSTKEAEHVDRADGRRMARGPDQGHVLRPREGLLRDARTGADGPGAAGRGLARDPDLGGLQGGPTGAAAGDDAPRPGLAGLLHGLRPGEKQAANPITGLGRGLMGAGKSFLGGIGRVAKGTALHELPQDLQGHVGLFRGVVPREAAIPYHLPPAWGRDPVTMATMSHAVASGMPSNAGGVYVSGDGGQGLIGIGARTPDPAHVLGHEASHAYTGLARAGIQAPNSGLGHDLAGWLQNRRSNTAQGLGHYWDELEAQFAGGGLPQAGRFAFGDYGRHYDDAFARYPAVSAMHQQGPNIAKGLAAGTVAGGVTAAALNKRGMAKQASPWDAARKFVGEAAPAIRTGIKGLWNKGAPEVEANVGRLATRAIPHPPLPSGAGGHIPPPPPAGFGFSEPHLPVPISRPGASAAPSAWQRRLAGSGQGALIGAFAGEDAVDPYGHTTVGPINLAGAAAGALAFNHNLGGHLARPGMGRAMGHVPLQALQHRMLGADAGRMLQFGAQQVGVDTGDLGAVGANVGTGLGAARGMAQRFPGANWSGQLDRGIGTAVDRTRDFAYGMGEPLLNHASYPARAAWATRPGGPGWRSVGAYMKNPMVGGPARNMAHWGGRAIGTAGVGLGAASMGANVLGARVGDYAKGRVGQMYEEMRPQFQQDVTTMADQYMQGRGLMNEQGQFDPITGAVKGLTSHADPLFQAMGMDPNQLGPWQKAMMLGGGALGAYGASQGDMGTAGLGALAAGGGYFGPQLLQQFQQAKGQYGPQLAQMFQGQGQGGAYGLPGGEGLATWGRNLQALTGGQQAPQTRDELQSQLRSQGR